VAYSHKFAGVFETLRADDWVIDGRTESVEGALDRVALLFKDRERFKATLQTNVAVAKEELLRAFDDVLRGADNTCRSA
jgi:hypothetical protein